MYYQEPGTYPVPQQRPTDSIPYAMPFGPKSVRMRCPHCQTEISTIINTKAGLLTYLACVGLSLFGCVCGCCLIPCCIQRCKDMEHTCPNCNAYLGRYKRI